MLGMLAFQPAIFLNANSSHAEKFTAKYLCQ